MANNIFIELLPPWVETGLQPAFYDKESGTVLQQTARMYAKVNELTQAFNDFSEATTETVNHYIEEFTTLYNYVHDYFDNLDVQEEINHKLDAMAEDGTLSDLISLYLNSIAVFGYDTVADMKSSVNLVAGSYARTLGFHTINDGGGALYKIVDTGTANEMDIISISEELNAQLISGNVVNVDKLGAHGNGTDEDTTIIQYAIDNFDTVQFSKKTYLCKGITVLSNKTLIGDNTVLQGDDTTDGIKCYDNDDATVVSNVTLKNLELKNYTTGLNTVNCRRSIFDNVNCNHCGVGASFMGGTWINKFYSCKFNDNTGDGFKTGLEVNHPLTNNLLTVSNTEFDFYGCEFGGNGGYGVNGRLHIYNFFGGFTDGNTLGGVRMYTFTSTGGTKMITYGVSFFGFDAEQLDQGYIFESDGRVEFSHVYIIGGQISLDKNAGRTRSAIMLKGTSCAFQYVNNLVVKTRLVQGGSGSQPYAIYADGISGGSIQGDIEFTNFNNAYLNTNLNTIINNGAYQVTGNLPLEIFGGDYFGSNKITIPNNKSITIDIGGLTFLTDLNLTTESASSIRFYGGGRPISAYVQKSSGVVNSVVEDEQNVVKWHASGKVSYVRIKNVTGSDVVITNIFINGLAMKNQ